MNSLDSGWDYWVDLETCTTSAQVLDWVAQIRGKSWANDRILAGLVHALDDILDLQSNLCSEGKSKQLRKRDIAERVEAMARILPPTHLT